MSHPRSNSQAFNNNDSSPYFRSKRSSFRLPYEPKIRSDRWVFVDDCEPLHTRRQTTAGPHVKAWREKFDNYGKAYKNLAAANNCLPRIRGPNNSSKSEYNNAVFSPYTKTQHLQKKEVAKLEGLVHSSQGQFNHFKEAVKPQSHDYLRSALHRISKEKLNRLELQKAQEELVKVLDPLFISPMKVASDFESKIREKDFLPLEKTGKRQSMNQDDLEALIDVKQKNQYIFFAKPPALSRLQKSNTKPKKKPKDDEHPWGSPDEIRLKNTVQEYCEWVIDLGGDGNIDESTINCLFTSGYDTTPAMSAPITLVKPEDVPEGLKELAEVPPLTESKSQDNIETRRRSKTEKEEPKKLTKNDYRYGAWYLHPSQWKWMRKDEQIVDPKEIEQQEDLTEMEMKKREMAEELSNLYITKAFAAYLQCRRMRIPEFVSQAEQIRLDNEENERQKIEQERRKIEEYQNRFNNSSTI